MKYSFIIATIGARKKELYKCIESIQKAFANNGALSCEIEIILISQGISCLVEDIEEKYKYVYLYSTKYYGLSRARNIGIQKSDGDYLCFIDDDALIDINYFSVLNRIIRPYNIKVMCGRILELETKESYVPVFNNTEDFYLSYLTYRYFMGSSHIVHKDLFKKYGNYDENLGAGSKYYACEETDYLFRLLARKEKVLYAPELVYYHPTHRNDSEEKIYQYSYGEGALFAKHILLNKMNIYNYYLYFEILSKKFIKCILSLLTKGKIDKIYYKRLKGSMDGFINYLSNIPR